MDPSSYSIFVRHTSPEKATAYWSRVGESEDLPARVPARREGSKPHERGTMDHPTLQEMKRIQRNYMYQPHLGFIPTTPVFEGPIWGRLKGNPKTFKSQITQKKSGKWAFRWEISQSWARLEIALLPLIDLLRPAKLPQRVQAPLRPSSTLFWEDKDTQKRALSSVLFAQKLFLEMAGELAYVVATSGHGRYRWINYVLYKQSSRGLDYPESWLQELHRTQVLNFETTKRPGYVIDLDQIRRPEEIAAYEEYRVPCFFPCANITYVRGGLPIVKRSPETLPPGTEFILPVPMEHLMSNVSELQRQLAIHLRESEKELAEQEGVAGFGSPVQYPECQASASKPNPRRKHLPPPRPVPDYPSPDPTSGQQWGQTCREFFFEREEGNRFFEREEETPAQRTSRLERRSRAEQYNQPGKRPKDLGAHVYTWEESSHPDISLRRLVQTGDIEAYWDDFYPPQRIYDEFANEWDLCPHIAVDTRQLPPDVRHHYAVLYDDGNDDPILPLYATPDELNIPNLTVEETLAVAAAPQPQAHADSMEGLVDDSLRYWELKLFPSHHPPLFCSMDPAGYAARRFGLQITEPFTPIVETPQKVNWTNPLGMHIPDAAKKNIAGDLHIREFVEVLSILERAQSTNASPNPPNLESLYTRIDTHPSITMLSVSSSIRVRCVAATSSGTKFNLYFIYFQNEQYQNKHWTLAVRSAANAVLALRERWGDTREDLVSNFLQYGIPFHTFHRKYKHALEKVSFPEIYSMPCARTEGKYTLDDYERYHDLRERFLDSPTGGIAGRSGGIVARLWRADLTKFERRFQRIMDGPMLYSLLGGYIVDCGPHGIYYDDKLTIGMNSVISGQYVRQDRTSPPSIPLLLF